MRYKRTVRTLLLVCEKRPVLQKDFATMVADDGMLAEEHYA
jgi:hypothetical protein